MQQLLVRFQDKQGPQYPRPVSLPAAARAGLQLSDDIVRETPVHSQLRAVDQMDSTSSALPYQTQADEDKVDSDINLNENNTSEEEGIKEKDDESGEDSPDNEVVYREKV